MQRVSGNQLCRWIRANLFLLLLMWPSLAYAQLAAIAAAPTPAVLSIARYSAPVQPVQLIALAEVSDADLASLGGITIGRGQDIVGAPIDFARMPRKLPPGAKGAKGKPALPAFAALPSMLPLARGSLTSGYGLRRHPISGGIRAHSGIDLAAPAGTPIYATAPGYVSQAGWSGGYGIAVTIEHGGGVQTRYGHMSGLAVTAGQSVAVGSVVGYVGSTGASTGPHVHYEVRQRGRSIDPLAGRR